ncbi:phosphoribosyl-ATP diphosphatase [Hyphomonas sp. UBA4494]|jgi:phosphoribosyl-ATP pyrophosphohydrolase|uniref:phosphoribosyl-ATP diphosphatase n=1 Tax=Hyphomonas sp. UBA4494 TaxID=1946631 RepID=UPI0025B81E58|nr:phosphoribosyl-ATP diphosphatase [Hyphomonas sp. UBA4494]
MTDLGSPDRLAAALAHLGTTIDARAKEGDASNSWTAKLLSKGPEACAEKVHEEGMELAEAVRRESDAHVASEAADVLYHAFVALRSRGVSLDAVAAALEKRQGTSGIDEKAGRADE